MNDYRMERKKQASLYWNSSLLSFMIGSNAAANIFRFNGVTTGENILLDRNLFAPAGLRLVSGCLFTFF